MTSFSKHQKYLSDLLDTIKLSRPVYGVRIIAAIVYKNRIISIGTNSVKTDPFQARFNSNEKIYLHAETSTIKQALRLLDLDTLAETSMYIARAKWTSGNRTSMIPGLAKPCVGCQKALLTFNIEKVYYTLEGEGSGTL